MKMKGRESENLEMGFVGFWFGKQERRKSFGIRKKDFDDLGSLFWIWITTHSDNQKDKNKDEIKRERGFECERVFGLCLVSESVSLGSVAKVVGLKKDDENDNEDEEKIVEEANRRSVWDQVER